MEQFTLTADVKFRIKRNMGYREEAAQFVKDYLRTPYTRAALDATRTIFIYDESYRARFFYTWGGGDVIELVADALDDGTVYDVRQVLLMDDEMEELHESINAGKCEVIFQGDFSDALFHFGTHEDMRELHKRMDDAEREQAERHARIDALHERIHAERLAAAR